MKTIQKQASPMERLAVCSWSLQPANPAELVAKLLATGIRRVQLALDPLRESPGIWGGAENLLRQNKIEIVSGMIGCVREDYSTMETIRATGGIAPDSTWAENQKFIKASAEIAAKMGLKLVTFHAGFLPHSKNDPAHSKMLGRLRTVAGIFAAHKITLGMETGQERAAELATFLKDLDTPNVKVNFDPANIILYDKENPVEALRTLSPWLAQVHIKDAVRTTTHGTWGQEVPVGLGEVDWTAFFETLRASNYEGDLVIEREAGDQRVADIVTARELVLKKLK